jgi:hypothetical protein
MMYNTWPPFIGYNKRRWWFERRKRGEIERNLVKIDFSSLFVTLEKGEELGISQMEPYSTSHGQMQCTV